MNILVRHYSVNKYVWNLRWSIRKHGMYVIHFSKARNQEVCTSRRKKYRGNQSFVGVIRSVCGIKFQILSCPIGLVYQYARVSRLSLSNFCCCTLKSYVIILVGDAR